MRKPLKVVVALLPWAVASFALYWLDSSGTWTPETPHRGKLSVLILGAGMALSLLLYSWLSQRGR